MSEILCPCGKKKAGLEIACDGCNTWFHGSCVNLTSHEIEALSFQDKKWFCDQCKNAEATQCETTSDGKSELIPCPFCINTTKKFKGPNGLKIHIRKMHDGHLPEFEKIMEKPPQNRPFSVTLSELKQSIPVLKRIPKGARLVAAQKLSSVINTCVNLNDLASWEKFLSFSYLALRIPERTKDKRKTKSLATEVKQNINHFSPPHIPSKKKQPKDEGKLLAKRVEMKVAEGDIQGAVKLLSSSDRLAPISENTFQELLSKHPHPSRKLSFPDFNDSTDNLVASEKDVISAICSFPNGSGSGIDGLRPQHLKDLISTQTGDAGKHLITSLTRLCNLMLEGDVLPEIAEILYGASLCALSKKDGGIRPIAVGNTIRRITAKICCQYYRDSLGATLRPTQLGFGTKGGCEAAVHATRTYINNNAGTSKVLLKIDFRNAFNTLERDIILECFKAQAPKMYKYMWQCYAKPSLLFFGDKTINSQVGAQQGDPAGPLAFCLGVHPITTDLKSELNLWYLDDGTIAGEPDTVLDDLNNIIDNCKHLGLQINPSKCELYFCGLQSDIILQKFNNISPGIKMINNDLTLLGAPLNEFSTKDLLEKKNEELKTLFSRLKDLHSHVAYFMLKNCFAVPKLIYLLRTSPAWTAPDTLRNIDMNIRTAMMSISNTHFSDFQWFIATLPIRYGGLGIRKIEDLTLPAFLASVSSVTALVTLMLPNITDENCITLYSDALDLWKGTVTNSTPTMPASQKNWDETLLKEILKDVEYPSLIDQARHIASQRKESNGWLTVLPSRTIGTLLDDRTFHISVALRFGCDICIPHICICGAQVDKSGIHGLSCTKSAGRFPRHCMLNDVIQRGLQSAQIPSTREPTGISKNDNLRPDGITSIPWNMGQPLVWDATCVDTLAPSYLKQSCKEAGVTSENAATRKRNKYREIIEQNYFFVPFAVETFGPWCEDALSLVDSIGGKLALTSGDSRSKQYFMQRISLAIQWGNAASIMGTFPTEISMEEIFLL